MKTISRHRAGKGFTYKDANGKKIADSPTLEYINSLVVPPAWQSVEIAVNKRAKVLAKGKDEAGRIQAIYHPSFRAKQEKAKFDRILRFAEALPNIRRVTNKHLQHKKLDQDKVLACVVQLIDQVYFRVGNATYAQQNKSYGVTTLRSKHATIKSDSVVFEFVGKSGQDQVKEVNDATLTKVIKRLDNLPGYEIFKYYDDNGNLKQVNSADVNRYIKTHMGEEFTAKDFRTWGGTVLASAVFASEEFGSYANKKDRTKAVSTCVKHVAKKLGNTPAVCRKSYIDPRIINAYTDGYDFGKLKTTVEKLRRSQYMDTDERCLLKHLQQI